MARGFNSRNALRACAKVCLTLVLGVAGARADSLPSAHAADGLDRAFHYMYNLDFDLARQEIATYSAQHPGDPRGPVAEASTWLFQEFERLHILQSEFFETDDRFRNRKPLTADPEAKRHFDDALMRAEAMAARLVSAQPGNRDALFSLALVNGLRADYTALLERRDLAALGYTKKATEWAEKLLAADPGYYDAYLATGLGKYLVGLKPAPVRWILRLGGIKGDREEGMQDLELAARSGRLLAPFARILLAVGYIRNKERAKALELLSGLRDEFPGNPLFAREVSRLQSADGQKAGP